MPQASARAVLLPIGRYSRSRGLFSDQKEEGEDEMEDRDDGESGLSYVQELIVFVENEGYKPKFQMDKEENVRTIEEPG
jgi:hypothetical protein